MPGFRLPVCSKMPSDFAGLLDSQTEPSIDGPPRRYYTITALGREVLQQWTESWSTTRASVDAILEGKFQ